MVVANPQNYTLMDILSSSQFYESIITARDITKQTNHESSFCVHGNLRRYIITSPLEEEAHTCVTWEKENGEHHPPKGFGLYTPPNHSRLVDLHYHSPSNTSIPSRRDLIDQLEILTQNSELYSPVRGFRRFNLVCIIAHHSSANNVTKLFFGQYVPSGTVPEMSLPLRLNRLLRKECGGDSKGYDCLNPRLPWKAAQVLTATGKYRAEVVSFRKRSEYDCGLRKLEGWSL